MMLKYFPICALLLLIGCAPRFIRPEDMPDVIRGLSGDKASVCFLAGGRAGGGGGAIVPVPVVPGVAYGSGEIVIGRVNSENTVLQVGEGTCTIVSGAATVKENANVGNYASAP